MLFVGDFLIVAAFVYIGQKDHELINDTNPLLGVLWTTTIFAVPWVVSGWLLGAFPNGETLTVRSLLTRSLNTWLVAAPLGILLRSYILGRAVVVTAFITVTLGFGGLFVLGWRLAFALIWWRLNRASIAVKPT
ncbi:MAG TPA: DUF3054 domain-containing protein [Anaerolineales bacterium]|nr:DUF3054 domain-containing protein [Anaerolineales bacterium]